MARASLYVIGLTGGIACGKSTVVDMLGELGAHTIDADRVTHRLQEPGTPVYDQIVAAFGPAILAAPAGPIDRGKLGARVFANPAELQQLEAIVHPAVRAEVLAWLEHIVAGSSRATTRTLRWPTAGPVAVIDAIKLLEGGWHTQCNAIWVVTSSEAAQIRRLVEHRGMSEAEARLRIAAQPPQESRLAHASVVIDNSGTLEQTHDQVVAAWQKIRQSTS